MPAKIVTLQFLCFNPTMSERRIRAESVFNRKTVEISVESGSEHKLLITGTVAGRNISLIERSILINMILFGWI